MKKVLIALLGVIVLFIAGLVVLMLVTPTDFRVQREVVIDKPRAEVFKYIKTLNNQNEWGPWVKKDPNIKLTSSGTDGEVGYVSRWESEMEDVGHGEQEITKIVDGERIDSELRFKKPMEATSQAYITTEDAGEGKTKVTWGFTGSMDRPMNLMLVFMDMDAMVGKDFEEGLANLKSIVEKQTSPEPQKPESGDADANTNQENSNK
ncbi:MAG: SRPBCC family protein [Pyrinomonadaceae bacterium]